MTLQEGAFALVCKSAWFPGEIVATRYIEIFHVPITNSNFRRGSPLLIGIKSDSHLMMDNVPVIFNSVKGLIDFLGTISSSSIHVRLSSQHVYYL